MRADMRKKLGTILVIMMMITSINVTGQEGFSSWADTEGNQAVKQGLVPNSLNSEYQTKIKRYEYVLLALEILELKNRSVNNSIKYPFSDISGHEYEDEIITAYNAGIINGDGNGHFYPDKDITRQEITALVCNLTKTLDEDTDIYSAKSSKYADASKISNWAKVYVNYCYENNIMRGVGAVNGLDRIDPKGNATREQAILLLFRLAKNKNLFNEYELPTIDVVAYDSSGNKINQSSDTISDFANDTSVDIAKLVSSYSKLSDIEVLSLTENYFKLGDNHNNKITFLQTSSLVELTLTTTDTSYDAFTNKYLTFVDYYSDKVEVADIISRANTVFKTDKTYRFEEHLNDNVTMIITYSEFSQEYYYKVIIDYRL